jgi:hypothetical protein
LSVSSDDLRHLLGEKEGGSAVSSSAMGDAAVRLVLHQSLHLTFWAVFVIGLMTVALALLVPPTTVGRLREAAAE